MGRNPTTRAKQDKPNSPEGRARPKAKWNLNTVYISERLQESLRPISRCAMTAVVAPMGYGKTTAGNWYLAERAKAEAIKVIRISVYSDNLEIFWKSVQNAFVRAVPAKDLTFGQCLFFLFRCKISVWQIYAF